MTESDRMVEWFDAHRGQLRGLAYRMLGSLSDVDDALQETWLRAGRVDPGSVENPGQWLKTILARVCLNMLRTRTSRREESLEARVPDPIVAGTDGSDPEQEALLAESIGLALMVVVQSLAPAERLAFVLHDVFDLPFDQIASILEKSPAATRQLASRARRRVQGASPAADTDLAQQRRVVDAFFAAGRSGDLAALVALLDPDVVLRADRGPTPASRVVRGAEHVVRLARAPGGATAYPAVVNGAAGAVIFRHGQPFAVMGFTVRGGRIAEIDILADPERLRRLDLGTVTGIAAAPVHGGDEQSGSPRVPQP